MKASLVFLLIALYGACALDGSSEEHSEEAEPSVDTTGSTELGSKVQGHIEKAANWMHSAVAKGSADLTANLDLALDKGQKMMEKAAELQKTVVDKLTSRFKDLTGNKIEKLNEIQAHLEAVPFGSVIGKMLAAKIQGMKLANKGVELAGKMETAKGQLMADGFNGFANAARGIAGIDVSGAKKVSASVSANVDKVANAAKGIAGIDVSEAKKVSASFSANVDKVVSGTGGNLAGSKIAAVSDSLSGSVSSSKAAVSSGLSGFMASATSGISKPMSLFG